MPAPQSFPEDLLPVGGNVHIMGKCREATGNFAAMSAVVAIEPNGLVFRRIWMQHRDSAPLPADPGFHFQEKSASLHEQMPGVKASCSIRQTQPAFFSAHCQQIGGNKSPGKEGVAQCFPDELSRGDLSAIQHAPDWEFEGGPSMALNFTPEPPPHHTTIPHSWLLFCCWSSASEART